MRSAPSRRARSSAPPAILAGLVLTLSACGGGAELADDGERLRFADPSATAASPSDADGSTTIGSDTTGDTAGHAARDRRRPPDPEPQPIELGTPERPFAALPRSPEARAIRTPTGVVLPVIDEREDSWLVSTPCQNIEFVTEAEPIGRAHVVLDPGHGGYEVGAAGATGLTEKELNLRLAERTAELLEQAGATVVLARTGDYTITAASRGHIAKAVDPALLVSIHHNGGAPAGGDRPGTIIFTKTGNPAATRFGGLLHQAMEPMLTGAGEWKNEEYRIYAQAVDAHEELIAAYDRSVAARDAALVANGQVPAEATTTIPPTTASVGLGQYRVPDERRLSPTTTVPPTTGTDGAGPQPVPESLPPPPPFTLEPVRRFTWAGTGNAGVRAWTRADGKDYLAVLRHSGDVPAVLAEFLYLTNPSEEELLGDPAFVDKEAEVLAKAIVAHFSGQTGGTGHVQDQYDDQPIGGSGGIGSCIEPDLE